MRSYKDSSILSSQQLGHSMEDLYSAPHIVIHRADLHGALLEKAESIGVVIKLGCHMANLDFDEPSVQLSDGVIYTADVILGADGEKSASREALIGRGLKPYDSGDHVFRITVSRREMMEDEQLAKLIDPPCLHLWVGPGAFAMTYALKRDDLFNIVLTCAHEPLQTVGQPPQRVDIREAREAFASWDRVFQRLLGLGQDCGKWNLVEYPETTSWTHTGGRFALIGDSAHPMLPWIGQGAASVFEDAACLEVFFNKIQHRSQVPDILSIYERLRKPRTSMLRHRTRMMRDVYEFPDGALQVERDRQMLELAPFDGFPNFLADPTFKESVFGYRVKDDAERAWKIYSKGEWPSTRGMWDKSKWD
ncbi:MAG: hypothetical protein Q9220_001600 [cf. Caloplaca sp. 1 TL-2023]